MDRYVEDGRENPGGAAEQMLCLCVQLGLRSRWGVHSGQLNQSAISMREGTQGSLRWRGTWAGGDRACKLEEAAGSPGGGRHSVAWC